MSTRGWVPIVLLAAAVFVALCFGGTLAAAIWALAPRLSLTASAPVTTPAVSSSRENILGTDLSGHPWTLEELQGRPYVLNFWASWCGPCREEMPEMQRLAEEFAPEGVVVILINEGESADQAQGFLHEYNVTLPCILDQSGQLGRRYRVRGLPTTVMIDAEGKTAARMEGYGGPGRLRRAFEILVD